MNVNPERGEIIKPNFAEAAEGVEIETNEELEETKNEMFESLLDFLGVLSGNPDGYEDDKEAILNSGMTLDQFGELLGENVLEKMGPREISRIPVQMLNENAKLPVYAHETDACADLFASEDVTINPGETSFVPTGLCFAIPMGYVMHLYPRSSTGAKTPLRLANSVGVIDSGYRGEVKGIFTNTGDTPYEIKKGDRVMQISIDHSPMGQFYRVDDVSEIGDDRKGGFGSTGK